eukprot:GSA120T00018286001.1
MSNTNLAVTDMLSQQVDREDRAQLMRAVTTGFSVEAGGFEDEEDYQFDFYAWLYTRKILIWLFLEEPFLSRRTTMYSLCILGCIVTALFLSIQNLKYTFVPDADNFLFQEGDLSEDLSHGDTAAWLKMITVTVLTLETIVRVIVVPVKSVFFLQPYGICDIFAILPFWLNDVCKLSEHVRIFHILTLFSSLFWLLKLCRYFSGWHLLHRSLSDSMRALQIPAFFLLIIVFIGSCSIFWAEQDVTEFCGPEVNVQDYLTESAAQEDCGRQVNS